MDQKLKERLLGALIILSVSVFIVPNLFKQNNNTQNTLAKLVPDDWEEDSENKIDFEAKYSSNTNTLIKPQPVRLAVQPIENKASKSTRSWVIRMGVFSHSINAKSLSENLAAKGYRAYSKVEIIKDKKLTHVFVGPYKSEKEIKKIRDHLKNELKIQGLVLLIESPQGVVL